MIPRTFALILVLAAAAFGQCVITLTPASAHFTAAGGNGTFTVAANPSNCTRTPSSNSDWLTISFGNTATPGSVGYTVSANTLGIVRAGTITLAGTVFTVTQDAAPCMIETNMFYGSPTSIPAVGGNFSFTLNTNCSLTVSSNVPWLTIKSPVAPFIGDVTVNYTASPNTTAQNRNGAIAFGSGVFNFIQLGLGCTYSVTPTTLNFTSTGGTGATTLTTDSTCSWTTATPATWITNISPNASGPATINFTVAPNTSPVARTTTLTVAGQPVAVTQAGQGILFTAAAVVNGASFLTGPIAPGEIFTIFGTGLGPISGVGLALNSNGTGITSNLANTRVLFDGLASPMIYASATQLSAIVPYSLNGAVSSALQVEVQGTRSSAVNIPIAATQPAIFTVNTQGTGQGAVLNQDSTLNSPQNPAAAGSVLQVFATGGGILTQVPIDGTLSTAAAPTLLPFTAQIAGQDAPVTYAGAAPGLVSGVLQVNVQIPATIAPGNAVPLTIKSGGNTSPVTVTVAIH